MQAEVPVLIRPARISDATALAALAAQTFYEAYLGLCDKKNLDVYVREHHTPAKISRELFTPAVSYFVAEDAGGLVGFLKLSQGPAPKEISGKNPLKLDRLYVVKRLWGQSLGRRLMELSLAQAEAQGHDVLWLSVWDKNPRAMRFYERWGFKDVGMELFIVGDDHSEDRLLEREVLK